MSAAAPRDGIAIVGMACRYADAPTPAALWETVLAGRRAFRRLPDERLRRADYHASDRATPDRTYAMQAAVLADWQFPRERFRIARSTVRTTDLAHWLALDVAADALDDAGYPDAAGAPRDTTTVVIGNTLTGELSRANALRLRWPYVRRVVDAALGAEGWAPERRAGWLAELETRFKAPFPPVDEDTLAGGLANTIAGRVCNQWDFHGGGYTVDGACASSLLAVLTGCTALAAGDADLVLAGGVDISLDPFELVGFARTGALAEDAMRVYDERSRGFWPGEGCGIVVLMREADAWAEGRRVHAVVRGWGMSSDGSGGITRPTVRGQQLALERAYRRARFGPDTVGLFEGHGTGTEVGDATELRALSATRAAALAAALAVAADRPLALARAAVGSVKANIGHTKAAAGVAGLLKAAMAVRERVVPPTTGCERPHAELRRDDAVLAVRGDAAPWPDGVPARAAVSAMGFGGINTHVVLEEAGPPRHRVLTVRERVLAASPQDCELLALAGDDAGELADRVEALAARVDDASCAELGDVAAALARSLAARGGVTRARAAVVAGAPGDAAALLRTAAARLRGGGGPSVVDGVHVGLGAARARLGFLCSGQGGPVPDDFGFLGRRFPELAETPGRWHHAARRDAPVDTSVAQPNIVRASLAALQMLDRLGVHAVAAVGHSLGELVALHWAGALDAAAAWRIADARGRAMAACGGPPGAMASLAAGPEVVRELVGDAPLVIAAYNGPRQTVVAGPADAAEALVRRARAAGVAAARLAVSHAFHSPLVAPAVTAVDRAVAEERVQPPGRRVVSTVTGDVLPPDANVRALLRAQITQPVRFAEAFAAAPAVDLWVEVGPGDVLCGLARELGTAAALPTCAGRADARPLCTVVAAAFALGAPVAVEALFAHRFARPTDPMRRPAFIASPCESAPLDDAEAPAPSRDVTPLAPPTREEAAAPAAIAVDGAEGDPLGLVRRLAAARAELPVGQVRPEDRLLADLHLSSITVGELVAAAARLLGIAPSVVPTEYAAATVAEVAEALAALRDLPTATAAVADAVPAGVAPWVRVFESTLVERPRAGARALAGEGGWTVLGPTRGSPLATALRERLTGAPGSGTVVCVEAPVASDRRAETIELLLAAVREAAPRPRGAPLAVVHHDDAAAAAFARSLHLERPGGTTCVVSVPAGHPAAADWVYAELAAARGFVEAHVDAAGRRRVPVLRPRRPPAGAAPPLRELLGSEDLLLVTGGGKGIAAECALDLARETGARLLLVGRAAPEQDAALATNLERVRRAGVTAHYRAADVTDGEALRRAVDGVRAVAGPVTAVLHGAGVNEPRLAGRLDAAAVELALAPKLDGARNALAAVEPERLRAWVSFGSVIGRAGLAGEAHYALANAALARFTDELQERLPTCRCRCVEWSVWAGVGMGERLGSVEALSRQGITPLQVDDGVRALRRVLGDGASSPSVVVTGRLGDAPTVEFDGAPLPLLRFLERPRVWYPGVELVADATLGTATDPYLEDHVFGGARVLPAVLALEAMAQVAGALASRRVEAVRGLELARAIVAPDDATVTVRVAALAREDGDVEVVLRSSTTDFAVDHVRAVCVVGVDGAQATPPREPEAAPEPVGTEPVVDAAPLYGPLLFQRGRFRRLAGYDLLRATACLARLAAPDAAEQERWFGEYLPDALVLGDPGARDACLHAVQACVPHRALLPVGADRITFIAPEARAAHVVATEVARDGDLFTYDLTVRSAGGETCERWEGVRFRVVAAAAVPDRWPPALLGPYLERRVGELIPGARMQAAVGAARDATAPDARSRAREDALRRLGGRGEPLDRRADGRPVVVGGGAAPSLAYAGHLALAVRGTGPVGCDLEPVVARDARAWRDLLGAGGVAVATALERAVGEPASACATRVWSAAEALRKAGQGREPLVLAGVDADGWALLRAGDHTVATAVVSVDGVAAPLAVAVVPVAVPVAAGEGRGDLPHPTPGARPLTRSAG
jgi:enediyne polyketide synthase